MVKTKKLKRNEADWKNVLLKKDTVKRLMIYKINNDLLTYDQAIVLLLNEVGESQ